MPRAGETGTPAPPLFGQVPPPFGRVHPREGGCRAERALAWHSTSGRRANPWRGSPNARCSRHEHRTFSSERRNRVRRAGRCRHRSAGCIRGRAGSGRRDRARCIRIGQWDQRAWSTQQCDVHDMNILFFSSECRVRVRRERRLRHCSAGSAAVRLGASAVRPGASAGGRAPGGESPSLALHLRETGQPVAGQSKCTVFTS